MGQKAKNAGKKASKVCYKEADAKSCRVTAGNRVRKSMSPTGGPVASAAFDGLSEIDKLLYIDKMHACLARHIKCGFVTV